jgi:hypothetical protein
MNKKQLIIILIIGTLFASGCATSGFARYKGRALKFGIPIYQGEPSQEYPYKSLGYVKGEYKRRFFDDVAFSISNALEDMANNARSMNANAIIKTKLHTEGSICRYDGEAVVFDVMPKE